MRSSKYTDLIVNQESISAESFLQFYNASNPAAFPPATKESLKKFQETYPSLFKGTNKWSIDKHRKKFMDWIYSANKNK